MAHWRPRVQTGSVAAGRGTLTADEGRQAGEAPQKAQTPEQSYAAKVVTYIPAEIIAAYQAAVGIVPADAPVALAWVGGILLVIAPLWTAFATTNKDEPIAWYQALAAFAAFAVWLLSVQNPLVSYVFSNGVTTIPGYVRSLILIVASLAFPVVEGFLRRRGYRV